MAQAMSWLFALPTRRTRICIFALSMSIRVELILLMHLNREVDRVEPTNIAVSVAKGRGFANAFGDHSGPTAHISPLYPLLLSVAFRILGDGPRGAFAQELIGCAVASAAYALLPTVAEVFDLPALAGTVGGIAAALLPINFWPERGSTSTVCGPLFIALILIYSGRVWHEQRFNVKSAVQGGVLAGIVLLTEPVLLGVMVALAVAGIVAARFSHLSYWAGLLGVAGLVLVPWPIRNYRVLGAPIWTRSNLGMELSISNADGSYPTLEENVRPGGVISRLHPYANEVQLRKVEALGEVAYNQGRMQAAKSWIAAHPRTFFWLTTQRVIRFWLPIMLRPIQTVLTAIITLLGLGGFLLWFRRKLPTRLPLLILFVVYPLPYYIIQTSSRYRFPLEPFILLFACSFAVSVIGPRSLGMRDLRRTIVAAKGASPTGALAIWNPG